jgi:hypothetical protein
MGIVDCDCARYRLYGFNCTRLGKRYGVIIRWREIDGEALLEKFRRKYPEATRIDFVPFLPITAKTLYDDMHKWDWQQR